MDRARRRGVADAGLSAALAVAGVVELTTADGAALGVDAPLVGLVGILGSAVLLARRRTHPGQLPGVPLLWLALGLVTLGHVPVMFWGLLVPVLLALYSAARHGSPRTLWTTVAAAVVAVGLGLLTLPVIHSVNELLFDLVTCTSAVLLGRVLRRSEERAVAEALRAERAEAQARERTRAALADERARIARELHDVLGHSVSVMVVQAGAAEQVVDNDPELVRRALESIRSVGTSALADVRRAVSLLREPGHDPAMVPTPGLSALDDLADTARAGGLGVDVEVEGEPATLPPGLELAVYRIVQESLTNVRKHAGACRVRVHVRCAADRVEVEVRDDGRSGARPELRVTVPSGYPAGHGIIGMRERALLYGGSLDAAPGPEGFAVRAVLPRVATA